MELNDHPYDEPVARHREGREGTEPVRECRWAPAPVAASPRESDRHIGRIVQIDAWIGPVSPRLGAAEHQDQPDSYTRTLSSAAAELRRLTRGDGNVMS